MKYTDPKDVYSAVVRTELMAECEKEHRDLWKEKFVKKQFTPPVYTIQSRNLNVPPHHENIPAR